MLRRYDVYSSSYAYFFACHVKTHQKNNRLKYTADQTSHAVNDNKRFDFFNVCACIYVNWIDTKMFTRRGKFIYIGNIIYLSLLSGNYKKVREILLITHFCYCFYINSFFSFPTTNKIHSWTNHDYYWNRGDLFSVRIILQN